MIYENAGKLIRIFEDERIQIEAWGENSLRVRVTRLAGFSKEDWALQKAEDGQAQISIHRAGAAVDGANDREQERVEADGAEIVNGKIRLVLTKEGKMVLYNDEGKLLLAEYEYDRHTSLNIKSRELKAISGDSFRASLKWTSDPKEKLYGMGQYQNGIFNLKGSCLELAQRNSQATVPFLVSCLGYGFLWNNPAVGRAIFASNMTEWEASATGQIDFWITAGDTPEEILKNYMEVTGKPPAMPEHGLGFWQCKLRYQTQEELLNVAREYHRRGIPLDVIIADFFHWTLEGTWAFDPQYWPDPKAMVEELNAMGTKLMVSVWPTVSVHAPNYREMKELGYLVGVETGVRIDKLMIDPTSCADFTNPDARDYVWNKLYENYVKYGITDFWLDVAEPGYTSYDFETYRYYKGAAPQVSNVYPVLFTKMVYDGVKGQGKDPVNLVRCAWAGSQKYGALVWSGDIPSTFESFKIQIICGLQMAMAGIPWWTTDIGGFHDGHVEDPKFQELLIRWFEYAAFCPVMRLHGDRLPRRPGLSTEGGGRCGSGADNEIWSFGEENYEIMKSYIELRLRLKPYIRALMDDVTQNGGAVIRPLFYAFPEDARSWEVEDQFLFGNDLLVCPVTDYQARSRSVYLPAGERWADVYGETVYEGGQVIECDAPIERIPVFVRADRAKMKKYFETMK